MNLFQSIDNSLHFDQVSLAQLAKTYGTPLYVYSQTALTQAFNAYQQAFSKNQPLICYAVKANGNLSVLKHFASLGSGFDIVSGGELARVLAAGGDASKVIFSGVGKSVTEIQDALSAGVLCFNVESLPELDRINAVAAQMGVKAPISLRINPDVDAQTHPYISTGLKENKFGIAFVDALQAYRHAASLDNLQIVGIDCHIGSQLIDLSPLTEALERLLVLVDQLEAEGIVLKHIDIGGGVGIVYKDEAQPDLQAYADSVARLLEGRPQHLVMEPGRSLVGNAGVLLTTVEFVKQGETKNFVIVDAAMNDLMRPALYQAYHEVVAIEPRDDVATVLADVVGPICETGDFLAQNRQLAVVEGDVLAIQSAGAYASSMASNYNSRGKAAEVLVHEGQATLVRRRETVSDLWRDEILA